MRRLTFSGFLRSYVHHLAGTEGMALRGLTAGISTRPRLSEPLLLWAVLDDRAQRLSQLLKELHRPDLDRELWTLVELKQEGQLESALDQEDQRLRTEYSKVWRSYASRRDAPSRDAQLKTNVRQRILELEKVRHVSRYRMAKDLALNEGNLHAFLVQGNVSKLSLPRAVELLRYVERSPR